MDDIKSLLVTGHREIPHFSWSEWDSVGMVKMALRSLEQGHFDAAAMVVDAMTRDDRIGGCLQTFTQALPSLPVTFEQGKGARAEEAMKALEDGQTWRSFFPDFALAEGAQWAKMLGFGLGQNTWREVNGRLDPVLNIWHPRHIYWRWDTRSFWVNTESGPAEIRPGEGEWVVFAPGGLNRAYLKGHARQLYVPWLIRQWGYRDWARKSEVHGVPIRKGKVPTGASDKDKDRFFRELASLGSETNIRLPRDQNGIEFDVELLEAAADGHLIFRDLLEAANVNIAVNLLGQNLTTEVKGGSFAAASVHGAIRNDLLQAFGRAMALGLYQGTLRKWAELNFGDPEAAPMPKWKTEPPEDKKTAGDALVSIGTGIKALEDAGVPIDAEEIAERLDVPLREGEEYEPPEPEPAPVPGAAPGQPPKPGQKPVPKKLERAGDPALEGQEYIDKLVADARKHGIAAVAQDIELLVRAVEESRDFPELRKRLITAYGKMKPEQLEATMKKALLLAELAGRQAAREEVR